MKKIFSKVSGRKWMAKKRSGLQFLQKLKLRFIITEKKRIA
jgi:hypothetical protein